MGKKVNKTGRSHAETQHVRIYHWLMKTAAWRELGALERAIYLEIGRKFNGSNNGAIGYSVPDAAQTFKVGKSTAARALLALQKTGFIVCTTKGAFSVKHRRATEWRMTEFKCDVTHELASKDFTRWLPAVPVIGRHKQNTVPVEGPTVPVAGQQGTRDGTTRGKKSL